MTKLLYLLVVPVKKNNDCVSDGLKLLTRIRMRYLFYLYKIVKDK